MERFLDLELVFIVFIVGVYGEPLLQQGCDRYVVRDKHASNPCVLRPPYRPIIVDALEVTLTISSFATRNHPREYPIPDTLSIYLSLVIILKSLGLSQAEIIENKYP